MRIDENAVNKLLYKLKMFTTDTVFQFERWLWQTWILFPNSKMYPKFMFHQRLAVFIAGFVTLGKGISFILAIYYTTIAAEVHDIQHV